MTRDEFTQHYLDRLHRARWRRRERWFIGACLAVAVAALASTAFAGNYEWHGGANATAPRGTQPGGGWSSWCCGQTPNVGNPGGGSWGNTFQSIGRAIGNWVGGMSVTPQQQLSYMRSGPASNGLGGMDPESRGSGVTW